jgi:hypothetical protein
MTEFVLTQMHIEVARNSTDDFNLFHDKNRWQTIQTNPFSGPVALGFQLGCFVEDQVKRSDKSYSNCRKVDEPELNISIYELTFAGVVKPGDTLSMHIKKGRYSKVNGETFFSNRIALKANGKIVLLGNKRQSSQFNLHGSENLPGFEQIKSSPDRSFIADSDCFLKRKYMIVGNAKNFLGSAFAEQSEYIDEFIDKVSFPDTYPMSLVSSALLERAMAKGHDLIKKPMIYTSHKLSIDQTVLSTLKSNDMLSIVVSAPEEFPESGNIKYYCTGILSNEDILFEAEIQLAPLSCLTKKI